MARGLSQDQQHLHASRKHHMASTLPSLSSETNTCELINNHKVDFL